ncbi:hypothetical protein TruAng_011529 [Truncatella angustata]|nr:hypothetical protein TruAng_011529 [Truncatella angustata]
MPDFDDHGRDDVLHPPPKRRRRDDDERIHRHNDHSRRRSRSPTSGEHSSRHTGDRSREPYRSREGTDLSKHDVADRHHRHHHHHHHRHRHGRHGSPNQSAPRPQPAQLPYSARPLSKSELDVFRPLLARYLDVQKTKDMSGMDEREIKGRWKSFISKWNDGSLAISWYDPELFEETRRDPRWQDDGKRRQEAGRAQRSPSQHEEARERTNETKGYSDHGPEADEGDEYGPVLPGSSHLGTRQGPGIPSLQDLEVRRELIDEDRDDSIAQLRQERKADRKEQKAKLEELVPRAEAGTRERQLEKKKEINEKMKGFRERSPGAAEVNDTELMGGGDTLDEYKRIKASAERKKTDKEIRREEILRAKEEERQERLREYREREDKAMVVLKELARQRFG